MVTVDAPKTGEYYYESYQVCVSEGLLKQLHMSVRSRVVR
jgi:hypothetical protein